MNKKLSIIIPNYNNEKFLRKSIDCLINQTYKNIEIIVVNDGSQGDCDQIVEEYKKKDKRIKYVKHDSNKGLFQTRLTGASKATGDYIAFLDADDYTSVDFYRTLMNNAMENNSDIVIGNTVLEYDNGKKEILNIHDIFIKELNGTECLDKYFQQNGYVYCWHTIWNKIYSMDIWKNASKHYSKLKNKLTMTEDFAFSTVLFYYAKKITKVDNDAIFYCQHENSSTSLKNMKCEKEKSNIKDLITSFNFVEQFLKEKNIYNKYENNFLKWKRLFTIQHKKIIDNIKDKDNEINELMNDFSTDNRKMKGSEVFFNVTTQWDERLENIKKQIIDESILCVSFDIFDTLVVRPFYRPIDLFKFLDKEYFKMSNGNGIKFSTIRYNSEIIARENNKNLEEITMDDIYKTIKEEYEIDNTILNKLKQKEKELEIRFCQRRNVMYELYTLARDLGKKVICTSDMYLPEDTIKEILSKNGYKFEKIYLSSTIKKTKATGHLYQFVIDDLKIKPENILHIGDNYESDYKNAKKNGINAIHFIKTTDAMNGANNLIKMLNSSLPFWEDNATAMEFIGIRTMLGVVANKYFDNPYRTFNAKSDFNVDPYLIGYYALGMYMFAVSKWLIENTKDAKNDKISFMARDGYLIMKTYDILSKIYKDIPKQNYMYVSRKALIPVMITNKMDIYKMMDILYFENHSPNDVLKYLKTTITNDEEKIKSVCNKNKIKLNKNFKSMKEFNRFLKIIADELYDDVKHQENRKKLKNYFDKELGEKPAVFDVGYSARPEFYLSKLCNKKIDTYFLNINKEEAKEYAMNADFKLKTFFRAKPTLTGNAYELLVSKTGPSCIGYDVSGKVVKPIFEEYDYDYSVDGIVEIMQNAAIEFVNDMTTIFGQDIDILYYQNYYASLPIMAYFNATKMIDRIPLSSVEFEDDIGYGINRKMVDDMQNELNYKNQKTLDNLFSPIVSFDGDLRYNPIVDLNGRNKFVRLIYYFLFDRSTIKRRIKEILRKC